MSTPFQDFKTFCNKVGLDFQWANTQSPKPTPETNPSEIPSAVNETRQERPKDSVNCVFTDIKNAQLWNVFKKVGVNTLSTEPARSNMSETNASKTDCAIHNDFAMMDASPPTPSAAGQNENSGPSSTHGSDATAPSTAASVSTNHEPVPSLASSVSTSSSVYSSWDPPHPPSSSSFPAAAAAAAAITPYNHSKDCRSKQTNEYTVLFDISCLSTVDTVSHHEGSQDCRRRFPDMTSPADDARSSALVTPSPTPRHQDVNRSGCSTAACTASNSTAATTTTPSYMEKYLNKPRNWFEKTMGKYCPLFLRSTKNIDYDSTEFMFERKMIAVQFLLLDEHSEPRLYYNPTNGAVPFWKRPFNYDMMPSYDQLLDEAERSFDTYQYRYVGFQRIEPYSIFCPWKNTQREIDLVLDHIHFSFNVGRKKSLQRKGNITLDTLDSDIDRDVRIEPYRPFPSENLVYEGLTHPAEQSFVAGSPDASLIEKGYQALVDICRESRPPSNDFPSRSLVSAPQIAAPQIAAPPNTCRLVLVRECRTASESELNKAFWFNSKRKDVTVTVPAPPSPASLSPPSPPFCTTKGLPRKWFFPLVRRQ
ncbi:hypothetical protein SEUBUCD646_0N03000 [Saccharomyces eubayanus]|uniref:Uncharacterized protein n=1 Tax=Saccharomyces eubayanus TaxID=1080349 RepID=A0ABN8VJY7_SACEU|nr:hypothetical protein SEUBUCD650_0N02990 [Saccharomyces eubayanus]CAI1723896.1 hypothetical protein SEUBUCD646_0N03000 [Saccharomyces eubayanus]